MRSLSIESLLKRDRAIIGAVVVAITLLAWDYMIYEARVMSLTGVCECLGLKMSGPDVQPWALSALLPLFLMWAQMMVAMMLPSAAPMIITFAAVNRQRREQCRPYVPTAIFAGGYLVVWTLFSALAALGQWTLHGKALLSPMMTSTSAIFGAVIVIAAGLFQWTRLKHACITHCRSPLSFIMTSWREGFGGAFRMGLHHGAYCTGCCWLLMALLFVAGVMNMWWVALLTIVVLLEKTVRHGLWLGRITGLLLIGWGVWMLL